MTWQTTAESVALDMAKRAAQAALAEPGGRAIRSYTTDSGLLNVAAVWDGETVSTAWNVEGRPLLRAAAETLIANRMAARCGPRS